MARNAEPMPNTQVPLPAGWRGVTILAMSDRLERCQCQVCGHIYDPARGEPEQGLPPGVAFDDLPQEWVCPVCASPKDMYSPM